MKSASRARKIISGSPSAKSGDVATRLAMMEPDRDAEGQGGEAPQRKSLEHQVDQDDQDADAEPDRGRRHPVGVPLADGVADEPARRRAQQDERDPYREGGSCSLPWRQAPPGKEVHHEGRGNEDGHHDDDDRADAVGPIIHLRRLGGFGIHFRRAQPTRDPGKTQPHERLDRRGGFCVLAEAMLDQLTILAPGLLGGSVARAARARGVARRIVIWARRPETRLALGEQAWCTRRGRNAPRRPSRAPTSSSSRRPWTGSCPCSRRSPRT